MEAIERGVFERPKCILCDEVNFIVLRFSHNMARDLDKCIVTARFESTEDQ